MIVVGVIIGIVVYGFILFGIIRLIRIKIKQKKGQNAYKKGPNVCPHCKNPITKNLPECEWCGNKIC